MKVKNQAKWERIKLKNKRGDRDHPSVILVIEWAKLIEESLKKYGIENTDFDKLGWKAIDNIGGIELVHVGFARNFLRHQWVDGDFYAAKIERIAW